MGSSVKPIMLPYQAAFIGDRSLLKIWLASRQIGKSFAISMEAVVLAIDSKSNNMILSSSERQSKEVMQKVMSHLRVLGYFAGASITEDESKTEIALRNGSRIIGLPASPDTVRGFSGNVFLDEFAFHRDGAEIWKAMYPAVTRGYRVRVASTSNGKQNMFYRLWSEQGNGFSRHRTTIHDAVADGLGVDVDVLRAGIGDPDAWAQEFECAFIDSATAWITYDLIAACEADEATMSTPDAAPVGAVYLGVDIGRKKDLTVFWVLEQVGDVMWTRAVHVMRGAAFAAQRAYLDYLMLAWSVRRACMDATGIGAQLAEEAATRYGSRVEAVTFTPKVKEDLAVTMRRRFEDRLVRIPADREIREDLHSVQKITTASGNHRYDAARTEALGHADRFWALALALHAGSTPAAPIEYKSLGSRRLGADAAPELGPDGKPRRGQPRSTGLVGSASGLRGRGAW